MKQGICAKCDGADIEYEVMEIADQSIGYPYECGTCGHLGIEWYNLDYDEST